MFLVFYFPTSYLHLNPNLNGPNLSVQSICWKPKQNTEGLKQWLHIQKPAGDKQLSMQEL